MKHCLAFYLLIWLSCINATAQDLRPVSNTQTVKAAITKASSNIQSLRAEFEQEKHMAQLKEPLRASGSFSFQRPGKIRWEYTTPSSYIIVMNSGKMLVKNGTKVRKFDTAKNKVFAEMNQLMLSFVKGDVFQEGKFSSNIFESTTQYVVKLQPLQSPMKEMLSGGIEMTFDKKDLTVLRVRMVQNATDHTTLQFRKQQLNGALGETLFIVK